MNSAANINTLRYSVSKSKMEGTVKISGAKNSVLRLLAASLLTKERMIIQNFPSALLDVKVHLAMLTELGKSWRVIGDSVEIDEPAGIQEELRWEGRSIRNTLLILGALVARTGAGSVPLPGGCRLGERKIDLHELVLKSLGARVWIDGESLCATAENGLKGADIHLPIRSTGATENAVIAGCMADGVTRIWNPHIRPEIVDLICCLNKMGARISVRGQESIEVHGVKELHGITHSAIADNIEAITWLVGSVVTDGDVEILDFPYQDLEIPLIYFRESGARFYRNDDALIVRGGRCYPLEISTGPYPGINSDMQPIMALYGACASGETKIIDLRFPGRYQYAEELMKMGVRAKVEGNILSIHGGADLGGAEVTALDLRAGISLALAGFCAEGTTIINDAWQIERGYDNFFSKAKALNCNIERLE